MHIRIDQDPPTEKEIQQEKQRLEKKLKNRKRRFAITYAAAILVAVALARSNNPALTETLLSLSLVILLINTFAMLATAIDSAKLDPMTNDPALFDMLLLGQRQDTYLICSHDLVCEEYNKAVMVQQRQLTKEEATAIAQWYRKKHRTASLRHRSEPKGGNRCNSKNGF